MKIVRPITNDELVGFDENGILVHCTVNGDYKTFVGIRDVRRETCDICERGWEETAASLGDQTSWPLSKNLIHRSCLIRHQGICERQGAFEALVFAKVRFHGLMTMPNRYWPDGDPWAKKPWYYAELMDYPVKIIIGSRKRVFNIEFHPQGNTTKFDWAPRAAEVLKDENVTKEFYDSHVLIHTYGLEKMREYVKKISEVAGYNNDAHIKQEPPASP